MGLSENMRHMMEARGFGVRGLATRSGLTPAEVSYLLRDMRKPRIATLEAISAALGCDWHDLMGDAS